MQTTFYTRRLWFTVAVCIYLVLLCACASMSKSECLSADWHRIGVQDGARGYGSSRVNQHAKACSKHGVIPDRAAWENGRLQGIRIYCRAENGFTVGRRNRGYQGVCPPELEPAFMAAFNAGKHIYDLESENSDMADRRRENQATIRQLRQTLRHIAQQTRDMEFALKNSNNSQRMRKQSLRDIRQLNDYQSWYEQELFNWDRSLRMMDGILAASSRVIEDMDSIRQVRAGDTERLYRQRRRFSRLQDELDRALVKIRDADRRLETDLIAMAERKKQARPKPRRQTAKLSIRADARIPGYIELSVSGYNADGDELFDDQLRWRGKGAGFVTQSLFIPAATKTLRFTVANKHASQRQNQRHGSMLIDYFLINQKRYEAENWNQSSGADNRHDGCERRKLRRSQIVATCQHEGDYLQYHLSHDAPRKRRH